MKALLTFRPEQHASELEDRLVPAGPNLGVIVLTASRYVLLPPFAGAARRGGHHHVVTNEKSAPCAARTYDAPPQTWATEKFASWQASASRARSASTSRHDHCDVISARIAFSRFLRMPLIRSRSSTER
jgi:hypothetical protein